jgi:hypothetical protein
MASLDIVGLRGDDPLGFLAALGTLRLVTFGLGSPCRLAFRDGPLPTARLEVREEITLEALAGDLEQLARECHASGRLLVGTRAEFPPSKVGTKGGDPARFTPEQLRSWGDSAVGAADEVLAGWLLALYSADAVDEKGRAVMTPFYAPSGQMTLANNVAEPLKIVATKPGHVVAAFTQWRRVPGFTGANLDQRAIRDAGVEPSGESVNRGAPGPTWLALEGLGIGRTGRRQSAFPSVLWQGRRPRAEGRRSVAMIWPTWTTPLDVDAARSLLEHPAIALRRPQHGSQLSVLGVSGVWRSERASLSNSDGPLMGATRLWPPEGRG